MKIFQEHDNLNLNEQILPDQLLLCEHFIQPQISVNEN